MLYLHPKKKKKKKAQSSRIHDISLKKNKSPFGCLLQTIAPKMDESGNGERKDIPPLFIGMCKIYNIKRPIRDEKSILSLSLFVMNKR